MNIITAWLLVISSEVHGGSVTAVQPVIFPTVQACDQVRVNLPRARYLSARCIQTQLVKQ